MQTRGPDDAVRAGAEPIEGDGLAHHWIRITSISFAGAGEPLGAGRQRQRIE